jgi:hypothetical protein
MSKFKCRGDWGDILRMGVLVGLLVVGKCQFEDFGVDDDVVGDC